MARCRKQQLSGRDWTATDFLIELRRRGTSWADLSRAQGWHANTLRTVVERPWGKGERLVAAELGIPPERIWPSRYPAKRGAA